MSIYFCQQDTQSDLSRAAKLHRTTSSIHSSDDMDKLSEIHPCLKSHLSRSRWTIRRERTRNGGCNAALGTTYGHCCGTTQTIFSMTLYYIGVGYECTNLESTAITCGRVGVDICGVGATHLYNSSMNWFLRSR